MRFYLKYIRTSFTWQGLDSKCKKTKTRAHINKRKSIQLKKKKSLKGKLHNFECLLFFVFMELLKIVTCCKIITYIVKTKKESTRKEVYVLLVSTKKSGLNLLTQHKYLIIFNF